MKDELLNPPNLLSSILEKASKSWVVILNEKFSSLLKRIEFVAGFGYTSKDCTAFSFIPTAEINVFAKLKLPVEAPVQLLKTILILSISLNFFQKINVNYTFADKTTIDKSLFYNPIQKIAAIIYPSVEEWYKEIKIRN